FFNHLDQYSLQDLLDKPTYDILYTPRIPINEIRRMVD
ncbi:Rrf2 family transcriptional regulator, partial [Neisseria sp. P0001.S004]